MPLCRWIGSLFGAGQWLSVADWQPLCLATHGIQTNQEEYNQWPQVDAYVAAWCYRFTAKFNPYKLVCFTKGVELLRSQGYVLDPISTCVIILRSNTLAGIYDTLSRHGVSNTCKVIDAALQMSLRCGLSLYSMLETANSTYSEYRLDEKCGNAFKMIEMVVAKYRLGDYRDTASVRGPGKPTCRN